MMLALPPHALSAPRLTHIVPLSPPSAVPKYGRYEVRFDVSVPYETLPPGSVPCRGLTVLAGHPGAYPANLQLPYVPHSPTWIRHAFMDEDARLGVSVDALLTDPAGHSYTQPCFYDKGYDESLQPTGEHDWHLRFAPNVVGLWHYKIRVRDSQGTAQSPVQTFTVLPSASPGFVRVSPANTSDFAFTNGATFLPAATYGSDPDIKDIARQGAYGFVRDWVTNFGLTNSQTAGNGLPFQGNRMTWAFTGDTGLQQDIHFIDPARSYHYTGWIKIDPRNLALPGPYVLQFGKYAGPSTQVTLRATSEWQPFSIPVSGSGSWENHWGYDIHAYDNNGASPMPDSCFLAQYGLIDDKTGERVSDGDDNDISHWSQIDCAILDHTVDLAMFSTPRQYLQVLVYRHDQDPGLANIDAQDSTVPGNQENLYGNGTFNRQGTTPNQAHEGYFARYFMARWGWSPAVAAVEFDNESNPTDGATLPFTDTFGANLHRWGDHRVLMTDSEWYHGFSTADVTQYDSPAFPDIDFSDIHYYPIQDQGADENVASLAHDYNFHNSEVVNTGGPRRGEGYLLMGFDLPRDTSPAQRAYWQDTAGPGSVLNSLIPLPNTYQGRGTWMVSAMWRLGPSAVVKPHQSIFQLVLNANQPLFGAANYQWFPAKGVTTPAQHWTPLHGTFTIKNSTPFQFWAQGLDIQAGGLQSGDIEVTNLMLTAPNGKVWYANDFSDPSPSQDWAAFTGRILAPDLLPDGGPRLGKPLIDGECEVYGDQAYRAYGPNGATGAYSTTDDPKDLMAEEAAWGCLSPTAGIMQFWEQAEAHNDNNGGWAYYGAVQRFLAAAPAVRFADGKWRAAGASADNPQLCANYAQENEADKKAVAYVFNRQATWVAQDTAPGSIHPQSGLVRFPHLPAGTYTVQYCSTNTGAVQKTTRLRATAAGLRVPIAGLRRDVALKIFR